MKYRREALHHLIERALQRNTFTAHEAIRISLHGDTVLLHGIVSDSDLIPEVVATVESVAPFLTVYSLLRVRSHPVAACD